MERKDKEQKEKGRLARWMDALMGRSAQPAATGGKETRRVSEMKSAADVTVAALERMRREELPSTLRADVEAAWLGAKQVSRLAESIEAQEAEEVTCPTSQTIADCDVGLVTSYLESKPTLLVVDDNEDLRLLLQSCLGDEYEVLIAANGVEALRVLGSTEGRRVDIVVSDVMMPEMDGIELFRHMRHDINFSHIPVILLTAKSSEENIVAGLEEGVADYVTKPFSIAVLRLRIRKILEWAERVRSKVARGVEIKPSDITVSSLDEELISHVIALIEVHLRDTNYSVAQLSKDVGMTRGHLYKKLMAITGKSPLEFMRIIKLKRGKSLLDQGKTNISEVADMVGYSAKQFSYYFKMMYGEVPSEYLRLKARSERLKTIADEQ